MRTGLPISLAVLLLLPGAAGSAPAQQSRTAEAEPRKADPLPPRPTVGLRGHLAEAQPTAPGQRVDRGERRQMWWRYRARYWGHEHRSWHQRGGYGGFTIPEDQFHWKFGHMNWFRISDRQLVLIDGSPRFECGGYWFQLVDPWPEYWADTWYETDDVYIDRIDDGYYLFDKSHPDDRIAVEVFVD